MSIDNSPKIRQRAQLERKLNRRASYDRILIICEGEKTEPLYFEEIKQFRRLQTANVKVTHGEYGTSPLQIVKFAEDECLRTKKWEDVYCVFDRDEHQHFNNALQRVNALNNKYKNEFKQSIKFTAIPSIPCFELWLLLHFITVTKESQRDEIISILRDPKRIREYGKGQSGNFMRTKDKLEIAYQNEALLKSQRNRHGNENPYTNVGQLVLRLMNLGK
jgi:hypothetical protein